MPVSVAEAGKIFVKPTPYDDYWYKFLGELPLEKGWNCSVFGPSFHGKSTFALYFAKMNSQFGNVLYVNAEEDTPKGTLRSKILRNGITSLGYDFDFADVTDWEEIKKLLDTGHYKYVFRDSLHALAGFNDMKVKELWMEFKKYPDISFVDVLFSMKDEKNYKGDSDILHLSEFTIECRKDNTGLPIARMQRKNRYKEDFDKYQYFNFIKNKLPREVIDG